MRSKKHGFLLIEASLAVVMVTFQLFMIFGLLATIQKGHHKALLKYAEMVQHHQEREKKRLV